MNRRTVLQTLAALPLGCAASPLHALSVAALPSPSLAATPLQHLAAEKGRSFGSCLALKYFAEAPAYQQLILSQCDMATPEVHMKWSSLSTQPGIYNFDNADRLVAFCTAHSIKVRGHTLIWHDALPSWASQQLLLPGGNALLASHIAQVAGHFAGKVYSWDVVNEVLDPASARPDGLRESVWLRACGPGYLEQAFRRTAAADPHALLVWNENYLEVSNGFGKAKRTAMLQLLDGMLARQVPIHSIGLEAHLRADQANVLGDASYEAFLRELAQRGMKIFITELDVQDSTLPADSNARDQTVAQIYGKFLSATLRQPAVKGVVTWGLADRFSWIAEFLPRKDGLPVRPLPFDAQMQPKAAYYAIAEALRAAPATAGHA